MAKKITLMILAFALIFTVALSGCAVRRPMVNRDYGVDQDINDIGYGTNGYDYGYGRNGYNVGYYSPRGDYGYFNNSNNRMGNEVGYNRYRNNPAYPMLPNNNNITGNGRKVGTTNTEQLARQCEAVRGVDNAQVVVTGNTCYVGIDTNNVNAGDMTRIKKQCAERVKGMNANIDTVYVSTEANFFDRLRRVGDGLRNGRTIDGFTNQLRDMVRNITPVRY